MTAHERIDRDAAQAQEQRRIITQRYQDEIAVKVNWFIRSDAQKRRFLNAKQLQEGTTK